MAFMIRKRTFLIILFASILLLSIYMMFMGNFPKVVYEKQLNSDDLEKVSSLLDKSIPTPQVTKSKTVESDFFIDYKLERIV